MLSRVSSDESYGVNILVRRAVRAALALGAAMLLASLQVQAQTAEPDKEASEDGRRRRHRPQQHRSDAGSHALSAKRKQRILVRLQQAIA